MAAFENLDRFGMSTWMRHAPWARRARAAIFSFIEAHTHGG
jgi:hypothetical protein